MATFYDERDQVWDSIPVLEYMTFDEKNEADWLFTQIMDDVEFYHIRPQESAHWQEFMDLFGFANDGDVWDWDDFREWYDSV